MGCIVAFGAMPTTALAQHVAAQPAIPTDLTIGGMFMQADWVVKLVIIGLGLASIITWTVFFAKSAQLRRLSGSQARIAQAFSEMRTLADAARTPDTASYVLHREALAELALSSDALADRDGLKERIISRFERHEAAEARRLSSGVSVLATIGATAPFVGLFGTVWGIMNSFVGIAVKQTTNLAVVAPGIAEALLATAIGLVAAIPAVIFYNHFSRQIAAHRGIIGDTSAAILRLVSRDLSRGELAHTGAKA